MALEIGTTIATLQTIAGVVKKAGQIELTAQVIELQQTILQLFGERTAHLEEAQRLRDENADLRAQLQRRATLQFAHNAYWTGDGREPADGPYCAPCSDGDGKLIRMLIDSNAEACCQRCKTRVIYDPAKRTPRQQIQSRGVGWVNDY